MVPVVNKDLYAVLNNHITPCLESSTLDVFINIVLRFQKRLKTLAEN